MSLKEYFKNGSTGSLNEDITKFKDVTVEVKTKGNIRKLTWKHDNDKAIEYEVSVDNPDNVKKMKILSEVGLARVLNEFWAM